MSFHPRGSAILGFTGVVAGIVTLQLPHPFGIPHPVLSGQLAAFVTRPEVVGLAFATLAVSSLGLAALAAPRFESPAFPSRLPPVSLTMHPVGVALLVVAAMVLISLCSLARHGVAAAWYLPLLTTTVALAGLGISLCEYRSAPAVRVRTRLGRADIFWIGILTATVGWVATRSIDHWYYSWIGDETAFFDAARDLLHGDSTDIFTLAYVYLKHPAVDSLYQSLFLRVFGEDVFGWRLAEVAVAAVAAFLASVIVVRVVQPPPGEAAAFVRLPAIIAGLIVGCSAYTLAFCHIGYNNLHTLVPPLLIVLCLVSIESRPTATRLFVLGCLLGLCLYTFLATTVMWLVVGVFLMPQLFARRSGGRLAAAIVVAGGFLCMVLPILAAGQGSLVSNLRMSETFGFGTDRNWMTGWAAGAGVFWHNSQWFNHHVAASLLDPVAGGLAAIGLGTAAHQFRRSPFDRFLLLWFVLGTLVIALSHPYSWPSITRLLFVLPAAALLAARGATVVVQILLTRLACSARAAATVLVVITGLVAVGNPYHFYAVVPLRLPPTPLTSTVRALQEHPASPIIEIAYQVDRNHEVVVRPYPVAANRYSLIEVGDFPAVIDELEASSVFLVYYSLRLAETVSEIVSPGWAGRCYLESDDRCTVWIFEPVARSNHTHNRTSLSQPP